MDAIAPLRLRPGEEGRLIAGHPWIYANEIEMPASPPPPGSIVMIEDARGRALGLGFFNAHSLIAIRLLTRDTGARIDRRFWQKRLDRALAWRQRLIGGTHYRLAHAEADGLPGCVIDRFGDIFVLQPNSAGMDGQLPDLVAALENLFHPRAILAEAEGRARQSEGLAPIDRLLSGNPVAEIEILENGLRFFADRKTSQKTGWFFDQRDNRRLAGELAAGLDILDVYAYSGGFALNALKGGAKSALAIDRSEGALALANRAAAANDLAGNFATLAGDAFDCLAELGTAEKRFGLVLLDPPAFIKSRKDIKAGARAYRKLARLGAALVQRQGLLMISSCSHHMAEEALLAEAARGIQEAGRSAQLIYRRGAAADHPTHPHLPESAYLKCLTFTIA